MKMLKNQSGFTLVELMVVVAIIGILSAVAIPNFKKYQAKSKTSEAKLHLANIYTAESASMSDYDTYATCIQSMGVLAPPSGSNFYAFGFVTAFAAGATTIAAAGGSCAGVLSYGQTKSPGGTTALTVPVTCTGCPATAPNAINTALTATAITFIAGASGIISAGSTISNKWAINHNKFIGTDNLGM